MHAVWFSGSGLAVAGLTAGDGLTRRAVFGVVVE